MKLKSTLAALTLLAATSAHAGLVNGNFETGSSGWTFAGNTDLGHDDGSSFYWGAGTAAHNGTTVAVFNSGDRQPNGYISQTFATHAGDTISVIFDYGLTSCGQGCTQDLVASIMGADGSTELASMTAIGHAGQELGTYRFSFYADGNFATVRFSDVGANNTVSLDGVLDNVRVDVPEPASIGLLGLGLMGLLATRRRTRR